MQINHTASSYCSSGVRDDEGTCQNFGVWILCLHLPLNLALPSLFVFSPHPLFTWSSSTLVNEQLELVGRMMSKLCVNMITISWNVIFYYIFIHNPNTTLHVYKRNAKLTQNDVIIMHHMHDILCWHTCDVNVTQR